MFQEAILPDQSGPSHGGGGTTISTQAPNTSKNLNVTTVTAEEAQKNLAKRIARLQPIAERLQSLLGQDDPHQQAFYPQSILSSVLKQEVIGQLPNRGTAGSFKGHAVLGYVAGLVANALDQQKAAHEHTKDHDDLLKTALKKVLDNKVLVGPTGGGSYGIALYQIAAQLHEKFGINIKARPFFDRNGLSDAKLKTIQDLHTQQWGANDPVTFYQDRKTRDQEALTYLVEKTSGGFFVPTNPLSVHEVAQITSTIAGSSPKTRDILNGLGVQHKDAGNYHLTTPYADNIAGAALPATAAQHFLGQHHQRKVEIFFPNSAGAGGPGAIVVAQKTDRLTVKLAPDPNATWFAHLGQTTPYITPSLLPDGTNAPNAPGLGSAPKPSRDGDAVSGLIESAVTHGKATVLPTTDVTRQIGRAIAFLDLRHAGRGPVETSLHQHNPQQTLFAESNHTPFLELASATTHGALLTDAIESQKDTGSIRQLAKRTAQQIVAHGFDETDFLQVCTRNDPRPPTLNTHDVWHELETLADLQGKRHDGGTNKTAVFVRELHASFNELTKPSAKKNARPVILLAPQLLRPTEDTDPNNLSKVREQIIDDNRWTVPIRVAKTKSKTGEDVYVILDGHHRHQSALELGLERVPCVIYDAHEVSVRQRREDLPVSVTETLKRGKAGTPYPHKSTQFIFPDSPVCDHSLEELGHAQQSHNNAHKPIIVIQITGLNAPVPVTKREHKHPALQAA